MARDSSGPKNEPQYSGSGVPSDAADLTEVAAYAAAVGNRKAMTSAQRGALAGADVWPGLEVFETDTGATYVYDVNENPKLVSTFTMAIPSGVALPQNGTTTNAPPAGTPLLAKIQFVQTGTGSAGVVPSKILFQDAFPNACLGVWGTTITGAGQNPVIDGGRVDRAGFFPTWPAAPNVTVRFVYLAFGW